MSLPLPQRMQAVQADCGSFAIQMRVGPAAAAGSGAHASVE